MRERVLVVDDDPQMALAMERVLARRDHDVDRASDGAEAIRALARRPYGVVVTDLRMPGIDGHELIRRMRVTAPATRVIVVTAFATVESAVSCVRDGAVEYVIKPFAPETLERAVDSALRRGEATTGSDEEPAIVAEDPATVATVDLALRAAATDVTVLLQAESGAGKEVFARLIHRASPRRSGPFVAVNCAAIPRELLEAELFGHRRGAFTGALRDRRGHFEAAAGGTLLLDEIGEMSPDLQARLLRVLQERAVQPIGAEQTVRVDVRVVAATNRNLRADLDAGRFREDLYYRLCVLPIRVPPLRERVGDIEPLALRFARQYAGPDATFVPQTLERLRAHPWPGNVRELQNAVQRAVILAGSQALGPEHFDLEAPVSAFGPPSSPPSLEAAEREAVHRALVRARGDRRAAAAALGIAPRTLRHKLKRYRDAGVPIEGTLR